MGVEGLVDRHLPVLVELVVELGLGGGFLSELNTVEEGGVLGENVLATSSEGEGLGKELEGGLVVVVVLGLVNVGEILLSVVDEATGTNFRLGSVVVQPVLAAVLLLNEAESGISDFGGVVLNGGTNVVVLLKVDVGVKLNLGGGEAADHLGILGGVLLGVDVLPGGLDGNLKSC